MTDQPSTQPEKPAEMPYGGPLGELRDAEDAVAIAEAALAGAKARLRAAREAVNGGNDD